MVEERGANLSGGQRQRIAIARALATNPRILILDEATSALDYESERIIQRNMRRIVKDRTVIIVAHRLAAVRACDRIVGMADGRIVEIGSHEELIRRPGGLYAYLWGLQTKPGGGRGMNEVVRTAAPGANRSRRPAGRNRRSRCAIRARGQSRPTWSFLRPSWRSSKRPLRRFGIAFLWIICALVVACLGLAYFGRIDIIASAQGKFQPTGRVKVIEPVETGRVVAIHVGNDSVGEGRRRPDRARPVGRGGRRQGGARRSRRRRGRERAASRGARGGPRPRLRRRLRRSPGPRKSTRACARANSACWLRTWVSSRRRSLRSTPRRRRSSQSATCSTQTIATQKNLVATLQERVDMRTKLVESQSGAKSAVIDATETLQYQQTQLAMQQAQLASASTGLDVIARDSEKAVQSFLSDQAEKLDAAERQAEEDRQKLAKAEALLDNLTLKAPIDGRVQSSIVTNIGQVLTSGQEVMRVVPQDLRARDRGLCAQPRHRLRPCRPGGGGEGRVLPLHPLRVGQGPCRSHRQGRDSVARRQRHGGRPRPRLERVRLRRRRADAEPGVRGRTRAGSRRPSPSTASNAR